MGPSPFTPAALPGIHANQGWSMLNGLDLFSGIGGIASALEQWVRPVCYVEMDRYCQAVLMSRMHSGELESAPIWNDVRTFDPLPWAGKVDIITGGFPCQDISTAGSGKGLEGERSGLFFEIIRISRDIQPEWIFLENVPAITSRGGGVVITELDALGYNCRWGVLSAFDVGAPHLRERWWCLANFNRQRCYGARLLFKWRPFSVRDGQDERKQKQWRIEPKMERVVYGIPFQVDRIKGLGNSVVPQCAAEAFQRLMFGEDKK